MDVYQFTVIIERQPEGEYLVPVPALPGCYTEGRTLEEAREMAVSKPSGFARPAPWFRHCPGRSVQGTLFATLRATQPTVAGLSLMPMV